MRQTRIEFHVAGNPVDGIVCGPETLSFPMAGVVVCHPHPLIGGNADNPVVFAISVALANAGIMSMRFDFRKVTGGPEDLLASAALDVAHAVEFMRDWGAIDSDRIAVAGYSFGGAAILMALPEILDVGAFSLIAPPLSAVTASNLWAADQLVQVLTGDQDKLVDPVLLKQHIDVMPPNVTLQLVSGADHYFGNDSETVAQLSAEFLTERLAE
jgi:alpha/beta superfamily hydrolase